MAQSFLQQLIPAMEEAVMLTVPLSILLAIVLPLKSAASSRYFSSMFSSVFDKFCFFMLILLSPQDFPLALYGNGQDGNAPGREPRNFRCHGNRRRARCRTVFALCACRRQTRGRFAGRYQAFLRLGGGRHYGLLVLVARHGNLAYARVERYRCRGQLFYACRSGKNFRLAHGVIPRFFERFFGFFAFY